MLIEDVSVIKPSADVLCKKTVLKRFENFVKFTEKHLCQSLFFNRTAGLSLQLYIIKKDCGTGRCFLVNFVKVSKTPFLQNTSGWLLLEFGFKTTFKQPPEVFYEKGEILQKFTGKHLCWSLFLNRVFLSFLRVSLLKKRIQRRCFPRAFSKILKTSIL